MQLFGPIRNFRIVSHSIHLTKILKSIKDHGRGIFNLDFCEVEEVITVIWNSNGLECTPLGGGGGRL